jgi:hypothetical protein
MRRGKLFVITFIAVLALVGCATRDTPQPQAPKPPVSDYCTDGLLLTVTTDKKNYHKDEPVNVTLTFKNCSNGILNILMGEDEGTRIFYEALLISNVNQTHGFFNSPRYCEDFPNKTKWVPLKPGEEYQVIVPWIVPPGITVSEDWGYSILTNEVFFLVIVYRNYDPDNAASKIGLREPAGKYWTGICLSKPVEITFQDDVNDNP